MLAAMNTNKTRADQLLVDLGLAESREAAKRLIMAGQVFEERPKARVPVTKPGQVIARDCPIFVKESERFVSRGAYKLLTALEEFSIDVTGAAALDAGASTGGFADCLLQHGAARVYAVDVGYGQLHPKLRNDPRVVSLERVNIRLAPPRLTPAPWRGKAPARRSEAFSFGVSAPGCGMGCGTPANSRSGRSPGSCAVGRMAGRADRLPGNGYPVAG